MAGVGPSFDSLFDKLRSSGPSGVNGANHPSRPSSNPQFSHQPSHGSLPPSQRSSYGAAPVSQQAYGFDYAHARNNSNDSLLQTLESAISSHPASHRFHNIHTHHPPSFSPQPHFGSIDSQTMQNPPQHYNPSQPRLNRQLGPSNEDDSLVPQNYLMGLLHKQASGNVGQQAAAHHGRRSVDNIPQLPQRFEAVREGARSTSFAESPATGPAPARQSLPAHDQPLNDLVSSLLSSAPKQQQQQQQQAHQQQQVHESSAGVTDPRSIMSPAPREVANPAAADLLHQILGRSKPVQDDAGNMAPAAAQPHKQSPEVFKRTTIPFYKMNKMSFITRSSMVANLYCDPPKSPIGGPSSAGASVPDTAAAAPDQTPKQPPLFTYVNPFDQLSKLNPRNRSPKSQTMMTNGHHSPAILSNAGLSTPSSIPLPFSPPPPQHATDEPTPVEPKTSLPLAAEVATNAERHTPPLTQPYVEDIADPFDQEADVFDGEMDPFEGEATPLEGSAEIEEEQEEEQVMEAPMDVPDVAEDRAELQEEEEAEVAIAEAVNVESIVHPTAVQTVIEAPTTVLSPETAPPPPTENGPEKAAFTIYKFPMKPFSQITFNAVPTVTVPNGRFSDIAKMSRNVDQMDRNLISASPSYIVYATGKSKGGVRIIRQEDGHDVVLMKESAERTVNVALGRENQVLAVGVNGTVLWSDLEGLEGPMEESTIEGRSFLFPPSPLQDQNGGLTKSRTHLASTHPKVFAIGRGRFISLIHADAARQYGEQVGGITKINDTAYHANHSRTIDTQKVSKEFCFSEDDTTVVTIDKAGKIKFWDVGKLVEFELGEDGAGYPTETARILTEPVLTRSAVSPGEMYKATSVIFVDKQQPYDRRQALRYLIVGLQQNHVIQLWDIAIGRAVQELRFPTSSSGSDGLCSLSYHPKSGVIVVGNPNRNTISFIHLSTPKYNLQAFSQAGFIKAVSDQSPNLPKLDATAIMSSIVEYSLGDRGQLISLEVLDSAASPQLPIDEGKPPIFELYISHTKGLTCLSLCKEDIGFDGNLRVMKGLDAVISGACTLTALLPPNTAPPTEQPPKTEEPKATPAAIVNVVSEQPKPALSNQQPPKPKAVEVQDEPVAEKAEEKPPVVNGAHGRKAASMSGLGRGKKPRRDVNTVSFAGPSAAENDEPPSTPQPKKNKGKDREEKKVALSTVSISPELLEREVKKIEDAVNTSFSQALSREIGSLYRRFDEDRRVQQAASDAKQEAILRVVSNTLSSGLEATIDKIIVAHMSQLGLDLKSAFLENIPAAVSDSVSRQIESLIPKAVEKTLTSRAVLGSLAEAIIIPLREDLDTTIRGTLDQYLQSLDKMSTEMSKALSTQVMKQSKEVLKESRRVHEEDTLKIAMLTSTVSEMAKTIANLESTTARMIEMQQQLLNNQEKLANAAAATASSAHASVPPTPMTAKSEVEMMAEEIEQAIRRGDLEAAMLSWLQSKELQDYYFENAVNKYNPYEIIPKVSQVVVLTIAASVTGTMDSFTDERLTWLEACLNDFHNIREENTQIMLPRITAVILSRLQQFYMAVAEENPGAAVLKRVAGLSRITSRLMQTVSM
ncbi:hypothetical protein H072_3003 [Dactylellina haptotyla CBS 200.50]|uniref:EDC4-like protein pdc1 beta-propeller domain-containing protein n=1 Tax=Dactylellina haptotyla (strain CBS 200.50) TaxID=1284197 RepID=S8C5P7_DACHA|nr:hypothetical protein H072_3003 [Dactylellina haptotyla CBS 200.50]